MIPESFGLMTPERSHTAPLQEHIDRAIHDLIASCPNAEQLSPDEQRGIIARYTAALEGNFIYWMTAASLSVGSQQPHSATQENLREEARVTHPGMHRQYAYAAHRGRTHPDAHA